MHLTSEVALRTEILVTPGSSIYLRDKHLELLYNVLIKQGYRIHPFSLSNLLKYSSNAIWHIHWIDCFHAGIIQRFGMTRHYAIISFIRFMYFLLALALSKVCLVKVLWTIHNVSSHEQPNGIFENLSTRILLAMSDQVTAVNEHIKHEMSRHYGYEGIRLLRQGLYDGCYPNTVTREQARNALGLSEDDFVLLFFGIIQEYKGIDVAIEALDILADDSIKLLIAGRLKKETEYASRILALVAKNKNVILFDKFIPDEDLQIFFNAADYTIYPYRRIDNSGTLYLTLTFGVPTLIRGTAGVLDILRLNPNVAILIESLNPESVAHAIEIARRARIDSSEFEIYTRELSWNTLKGEITDCFNQLQH